MGKKSQMKRAVKKNKKDYLIITEQYDVKGGLRSIVNSLIPFLKDKYSIFNMNNKGKRKNNEKCTYYYNKFASIYLFKVIITIFKLKNNKKMNGKTLIISASPLFGFLALFSPIRPNIWFATSFWHEFIHKNFTTELKKNKLIFLLELFLLPIYFILENLIVLNKKINFFALSKSTRNKFFFEKNIRIMYPSIEDYWFKESSVEKENIIISVARFDDTRKDIFTLLKTAEKLPQYEFQIIGPYPKNINIEKYKNIKFLGEMEKKNIKQYLDKAKLFYLPSRQEGLGIVYLEALASGLPVITMKNGGAEDIIKNNYNGYLCNIGDYQCAAQKISLVLKNNEIYKKLYSHSIEFSKKYKEKISFTAMNFLK